MTILFWMLVWMLVGGVVTVGFGFCIDDGEDDGIPH